MNLLFKEIKKITKRKQFWIITIILFGSVHIDFFMTCTHYYGAKISQIPSAYRCTIISNFYTTPVTMVYESFMLPLIASIVASDIYYEERLRGIDNFIVTRVSKKANLWYKILSIVFVVFSTVTVSIIISLVLALSAFPLQGYYTNNVTFTELMEPNKDYVFSYLESNYPYLNILVFACIRGIVAVTSAILAFSVSFIQKVNRYVIILSSMLFYILYISITYLIGSIPSLGQRTSEIIQTNILGVNPDGSIWIIVFYLFFEISISAVLIRKGMKLDV